MNVPVLVLHSREDALVRFTHAERNFAAANEPKWLREIAGDHNDQPDASPEVCADANGKPVFARGGGGALFPYQGIGEELLALGVELYYRDLDFQSLENIYTETRLGARLSLTRALWSDYLIGSVSYTIENVDIELNENLHGPLNIQSGNTVTFVPPNVSEEIASQPQDLLISKVGASLASLLPIETTTRFRSWVPGHCEAGHVASSSQVTKR
jgi:hypothetical protein